MDAILPDERRAVSRHPRDLAEPIQLHLEEKECEFVATVRDISIVGMGILTQQQLEPGMWLVLKPAEPRRTFAQEVRAEVRHTTNWAKDGYRVGCRFARLLTMDDLSAFG